MDEFVLRIKKSELLTVVTLILKLFAIVIFFIGLFGDATEPIIQTCIMLVVSIIFDYINDGTFVINSRGVIINDNDVFKWKDIELLTINRAFIRLKIANEKVMRYEIAINEDSKKIKNCSKFIDSKLKNTNDEYEIELEKRKHNLNDLDM